MFAVLCFLCFLLFHPVATEAAHVYFNLSDFGLDTATHSNRITRLIPQSTPRTSSTTIITSEARSFTNSPTATFLASNLVTGVYKVEIPGRWTTTSFMILVPNDSATYAATALITTTNSMPSASVGYSAASADARFVNLTNHTSTNLVVGTNSISFTNECYVVANQNQNVLLVLGAGTTTCTGNYIRVSGSLYTKTNDPVHGVWFDGADWLLTNSAGSVLYFLTADSPTNVAANWSALNGSAPPPSSIFDSITNCFLVLASSSGLALPILSSNLYVDVTIGNDTNAVRGRPDRPWRLLQAALANQRYGDTVYVGPGAYPTNVAYGHQYNISNRVRLVGSGRGVTFIGTQGGVEEGIGCGTEVTLRDFTSYAVPNFGALGVTATNCLMENVDVYAAADGVYVSDYETLLDIRNCLLDSNFDGLADWETSANGSNRVIRLWNCGIRVHDGPLLHGIDGGDTRIEMYGGFIEALHGSQETSCVRLDVASPTPTRINKTGSMLLCNVRLRHANTNGISQMVSNFYNLPVFLDNCTEEIVPGVLAAGSFTNQWWHRNIAFPQGSVRTNWLVDTRSLTNALVAASAEGFKVQITDDLRTASGTNILIYPLAGQTISGGALDGAGRSYTNITVNGGSMVLQIRSNNWQVVQKLP